MMERVRSNPSIVTEDDVRRTKLDGSVMFLDGRDFHEQRRGCKAHPALVRVDRVPRAKLSLRPSRRGPGREGHTRHHLVDGREVEGSARAIAEALTAYYAAGGDDTAFRDWQGEARASPEVRHTNPNRSAPDEPGQNGAGSGHDLDDDGGARRR